MYSDLRTEAGAFIVVASTVRSHSTQELDRGAETASVFLDIIFSVWF